MKVNSGKNWGKNKYVCSTCGREQILIDNDQVLEECECGSTEFDSKVVFKRSEQGKLIKAEEMLNIISVSLFCIEVLKIDEFINVISSQLRILLIDGKEILKLKLGNLSFHPCKLDKFDCGGRISTILYSNLFDESSNMIPIDKWYKQEVAWSKDWEPIQLKMVIQAMANKDGGAHVDMSIPEEYMMAIAILGKDYIKEIARYILMRAGRDILEDSKKLIIEPYNNFIKQA